jgi:hypothetical protein
LRADTLKMAAIIAIFIVGFALVVIELGFAPGPDNSDSD